MPSPEASRPGDPHSDVEKKRNEYVGRLRTYKSNLEVFRTTGVYPDGETIENSFKKFQGLQSELIDFHLDYPDQAESLLRTWDILKQLFHELMEKRAKASAEAGKELLPKIRNEFESYLKSQGFPETLLNKSDPETLNKMRSFILTKLLEKVVGRVDLTVMRVSTSMRSERHLSSLGGGSLTLIEVIESADANIGSADEDDSSDNERAMRAAMKDELIKHINIIDTIFALGTELKSAHGDLRKQQILSEVRKIYRSDSLKAMLDPDYFIEIYANFPPLLDKRGNEEKISLGDAFFQAYKEIKRAGKKWVKDPKTDWIRPEKTLTEPLPPFQRNKALFIEDDPHHTISLNIEKISKDLMETSVAPEQEAGEYKEAKPNAIRRLIGLASKADANAYDALRDIHPKEFKDLSKHPQTVQGKTAAYLAYHWALILMDLDEMDNVNNRPVGQNVLSRVIHASSYANKTMQPDSKESKTNAYIVGRALSFVRPFGKFAVMDDGKTFEQAVMNAKSWRDLQIERWPEGMTGAWVDQVLQGLGEYERGEKGLGGKKLFDIAKLSFKEQRLVINQEVVDSIHEMVRNAYKYHIERDMVPSAVQKKPDLFLSDYDSFLDDGTPNPAFEIRRPPSEEFVVFTIVTADAKIDPTTGRFIPDETLIRKGVSAKQQEQMKVRRVITRFPRHYYVNARRLGRWIDDEGPIGHDTKLRYKGVDLLKRAVMTRVPGATPGSYTLEESGQIEEQLILRLNDGIKLEDKEKGVDNTPQMLLKRLIVEYCLEMISLPGDTMAHLKKEDWLPLGLFFSPEMRKNFRVGGYGTVSQELLGRLEGWIANAFNKEHELEFFRREDPGIVGDNVFTEKLYRELLYRMGHRITAEDFKETIATLFGGENEHGGHGKH